MAGNLVVAGSYFQHTLLLAACKSMLSPLAVLHLPEEKKFYACVHCYHNQYNFHFIQYSITMHCITAKPANPAYSISPTAASSCSLTLQSRNRKHRPTFVFKPNGSQAIATSWAGYYFCCWGNLT